MFGSLPTLHASTDQLVEESATSRRTSVLYEPDDVTFTQQFSVSVMYTIYNGMIKSSDICMLITCCRVKPMKCKHLRHHTMETKAA